MDETRIGQLTLAHLDGRISDEEFAELEHLLETTPGARAQYAQWARLDAELTEIGAVEDPFDVSVSPAIVERQPWRRRPYLAMAALAAVLLGWLIPTWILLQPDASRAPGLTSRGVTDAPAPRPSEPVRSIAVISAEADAVWQRTGTMRLGEGAALEPGTLTLSQGLAQIDFFSGASITLEGPAQIELRSSELAILRRGRIRADVPPAARGFEIQTADVRLEDLGTSFGVDAGDDGKSEVVVFDGEVRAIDRAGQRFSLFAGDAANLADGQAAKVDRQPAEPYPGIAAVIERSGGLEESRYEKWKIAATQRRSDPRLIAYYDFEGLTKASRRLPNQAMTGAGSELDGGIVGARVRAGRWPGKRALDFRGEGDRVRVNIPGQFDALTLYAWVRIDALDRQLNSLFLTDYYDPGEIHWQLSMSGALHFSTSPVGVPPGEDGPSRTQEKNRRFWSTPFWDINRSGEWFLVATTIDRNLANPVSHYINGKAVGFSGGINMNRPLPKLRIGAADLGNWTDPIAPGLSSIRSLNGRIDEFAIYAEALSPNEILTLYEQGRP